MQPHASRQAPAQQAFRWRAPAYASPSKRLWQPTSWDFDEPTAGAGRAARRAWRRCASPRPRVARPFSPRTTRDRRPVRTPTARQPRRKSLLDASTEQVVARQRGPKVLRAHHPTPTPSERSGSRARQHHHRPDDRSATGSRDVRTCAPLVPTGRESLVPSSELYAEPSPQQLDMIHSSNG